MIKKIELNGKLISYDMQYKNVKNINLRIRADGSVHVSASRFVRQSAVEEFLISKADLILKAINRFSLNSKSSKVCYVSPDDIQEVVHGFCKKIYPYFKSKGVEYPEIKFRSMVSQWGNCRSQKGVLTFNTNLIYAPLRCIEYVVAHEFTHFLQPNHSEMFYNELTKVMPDWKERRKLLKSISL